IAPDDDPVGGVGERDGEDAGAGAIVADRRGRYAPGAAAIGGMEDASGAGAAGDVPDLVHAADEEAGIAGGEGAFTGQRGRRLLALPMGSGVRSGADVGAAFERIADDDALCGRPESDAVEESFGIGMSELEGPVLAAIGRPVDARFFAWTDTH